MNYKLRKAHKYIWLFIIIVLPPLIMFSIKDLDLSSSKNTSIKNEKSSTNKLIKVSENELVKVSWLQKEDMKSVEVILKTPLKSASSLVYTLTKNGEKGILIGSVSTVGIYQFDFQKPFDGIVIYDTLKETTITQLLF